MAAVLELLPGRVRPFPALLLPKTPPRAAARVWWWLADSPAAAARLLFCFAGRFGSRMPRPLLLPPPRPFPARRTFHSRGFAAGLSPDPTERAPTAPTESRAHGRPPARAAAASATLRGLVPPVRGLVDISPVFAVRADDVQVLSEPKQFYESLKAAIRNARRRVVLAALYIGHGETDLISAIRAALEANRASKTAPRLEVTVLVDCLRGTRGGASSTASLLLPLTNEFPESLKVLMYHTPDLHGLLKKICPARFNEAVGLQHIKAYISDDDVMLTGANLSKDYFTNRQDRYVWFRNNRGLADYFTDLVHTVGDFSYTLRTFSSSPLSSYHIRAMTSPDPVENRQQFRTEVTARMEAFQARWLAHTRELRDSLLALDPSLPQVDTLVFPSVQMGPFGIRQDEKATSHLIRAVNKACHDEGEEDLGRRWRLHVTTGYFNLAPKYIDLLLPDVSGALVNLLAAAPEANGFFKSAGVSKYIPLAYTYIERAFLDEVEKRGRGKQVFTREWKREGWTYHAKGLWCYPPTDDLPSITMLGSPNFGYRSIERDLEAQVVVSTSNNTLRSLFHQELQNLLRDSHRIDAAMLDALDRRPPFLVKIASLIIKTML